MTAIVSKKGEILFTIEASQENIALNTPDDCIAIDNPPRENMYYKNNAWVDMPPRPSFFHRFNYDLEKWEDIRTLEQVKDNRWQNIKNQRTYLINNGFEFNGDIYDSNEISQLRILIAANAGVTQTWVLADNSTKILNAQELIMLSIALQKHISSIHERANIARQKVDSATSIDELNMIEL